MDMNRLALEAAEMQSSPSLGHFELFEDTRHSADSWERYFWKGRIHTGHEVTARYMRQYPRHSLRITVDPKISTHHRFDNGNLCMWLPSEWSPNFTAATAIGITIKFLQEHSEGITG